MKRVQAVWEHPLYQQNLKDLTRLEADRVFCRHTPEHFLDVARLAYIFALERKLNCSRELIYCTALLHDIGRAEQYTTGTPHDEAGARIAETILSDLDFSSEEKESILSSLIRAMSLSRCKEGTVKIYFCLFYFFRKQLTADSPDLDGSCRMGAGWTDHHRSDDV